MEATVCRRLMDMPLILMSYLHTFAHYKTWLCEKNKKKKQSRGKGREREEKEIKKTNPKGKKTEYEEDVYGGIYSRCSSPSQCTSPHPSSSKSVSERRTDSQLSAQRQAVFSTIPAFCCSPIVQVLLRDSCDENLINFNKLSWRKKTKTKKTKQAEETARTACSGLRSSSVGS